MVAVCDLYNNGTREKQQENPGGLESEKRCRKTLVHKSPPFGYKKDPEDKEIWLVDSEAASVVQKIYKLCIVGFGPL